MPNEPLGFLLKRIHDNIDRLANRNLKPSGLTYSQMRLLEYVASRAQTPPSQREVEEYLRVSHPTVVGLIKRLEAKGMVRCGFDSADRRVKSVYLTEEGRANLDRMHRHRQWVEGRLIQGMTQQQVEDLHELLKKVLQNVAEQ